MNEIVLQVLPGQEKKIARACSAGRGVKIHFEKSGDGTRGKFLLSPKQIETHNSANAPYSLTFTKHQLDQNKRHSGGFLSLLMGLLAPILGGLLGGLGKGLVWSKENGKKFHVTAKGGGLYLRPYRGAVPGSGLWYKKGKKMEEAKIKHFGSGKKIMEMLL